MFEGVKGVIWCNVINSVQIDSWFVAESRTVIWSWKPPVLSSPNFSQKYAQFQLTLEHNGDIQDEECITRILTKMSNVFQDVVFRIQTSEGDFLMFEISQFISEEIEIPDEVSVVYQGKLHHIPESDENLPDLPNRLGPKTVFPDSFQTAFGTFLKNIDKEIIYHNKTLLIPQELKRILVYDPNLISKIVPKAKFSKTYSKDFNFHEHRIKFRRYQYAVLDSMDIRVPFEFMNICKDKPLRYIKISYLLTIAFQEILKSKELDSEIENSKIIDLSELKETKNQQNNNENNNNYEEDDDEKWIDETPRPEFNYDDVGIQMAERVGEFMNEVSQFDSIEADGPINFDFDTFKNKIENFMDSSDDSHNEEEEEEEAMDQLFDQLENDEDKVLRCFSNGKNSPEPYIKENLEQSLNSQPADQGPAADLMHLFNIK